MARRTSTYRDTRIADLANGNGGRAIRRSSPRQEEDADGGHVLVGHVLRNLVPGRYGIP
ncbi:hypothetical protein [Aminivibrio sp.]|uniref:hypothetical protein n=1 Tax=Aminivibrio sp. TaxID=1872489 RepID=UPI001A519DC4|nr:hypothetical protein [Aminivibrio sp.]MBL3540279.1 hypothetical protein [Aminivibrio sp.]